MLGVMKNPLTKRTGRWAPVAIGTAAGLLTGFLAPAPGYAATAGPRSSPPVPTLHWRACDHGFQCATAQVPLNYQQPDGATISIAVMRHLATESAHSDGSLFINGGGPSEQLESFVGAYPNIPLPLRRHDNLVSFDPRGFGFSTAIRCFPSQIAENNFLGNLPVFPVGAKQDAVWERTWQRFDARCVQRNGSLLRHDTTADVARDMDLIRQGLHDPELNYVGLSYGSALGATYANLFPSKVGHLVLDGNVNPVTWSTDTDSTPVFQRLHSGQASAAVMTDFLNLCGRATTSKCAFSAGTPAATRSKFATLLRRVRQHPVTAGAQTFSYADVIASVPLSEVSYWGQGAKLLQQLWTASAGGHRAAGQVPVIPAATSAATATGTGATFSWPFSSAPVYSGQEQNLAVLCPDTDNPRSVSTYQSAAQRATGFGLSWLWTAEACADWPSPAPQDRYTGPWNRRTAHPVLLLGNTGDPALPYRDAQAMSRDLSHARLLTVDGYGHTEANNPSACAIGYEVGYLLTGALPRAGTVCRENVKPFH